MNARRRLHLDSHIDVLGIGELSTDGRRTAAQKLRRIKYDRYGIGAVVRDCQVRLRSGRECGSGERNRIRLDGEFKKWSKGSVAESNQQGYGVVSLRRDGQVGDAVDVVIRDSDRSGAIACRKVVCCTERAITDAQKN